MPAALQFLEPARGLFDDAHVPSSGVQSGSPSRRSSRRTRPTARTAPNRRPTIDDAPARTSSCVVQHRDAAEHRPAVTRSQRLRRCRTSGRSCDSDEGDRHARPASATGAPAASSDHRFGNTGLVEARGGSMTRNCAARVSLDVLGHRWPSRAARPALVVAAHDVVVAVQLRQLGFDCGTRLAVARSCVRGVPSVSSSRTRSGATLASASASASRTCCSASLVGAWHAGCACGGALSRLEFLPASALRAARSSDAWPPRRDAGRCSGAAVRRAACAAHRAGRRVRGSAATAVGVSGTSVIGLAAPARA